VRERFEAAVFFCRREVGDLVSCHFLFLGSINESDIFRTINKDYKLTDVILECSLHCFLNKVTLIKVEFERES